MHRRAFVTTAVCAVALPDSLLRARLSVGDQEAAASQAEGGLRIEGFKPSLHAWPFRNFSSQGLLDMGNCGGMCWSALDRFINRQSARGSLTTGLRREIENRQKDTLNDWLWAKVGEWQQKPSDDSGPLQTHSLKYSSRQEWPTLRKSLDARIPINVILIIAEPSDSPGKNHQVLAYEYSQSADEVTMAVYDSNQPNVDDVKIRFSLSGDRLSARFVNSRIDYNRLRGFMAVPYDRDLNVHIHQLTSLGKVGERVDHRAWSSGWTSAVFHKAGGAPGLVLLKVGNGKLHTHSMAEDGVVGDRRDTRDWTSGWTSLATYEAGSATYIMLLKRVGTADDGSNVHVHRVETDGTLSGKLFAYQWTEGWTHVVPYSAGGATFLFLLKQLTGLVHVHRLRSDGSVGERIDTRDWTTGWSTVAFYDAGGTTYLFLLKVSGEADSGANVHIHRVRPDGKIGERAHTYSWTEGWTSAEPYVVDGAPHLLILKSGNGRTRIHRITANGEVGEVRADYDWSGGWSTVRVFQQAGTNYLFLMKSTQSYDGGWWPDLPFV